MVRGYYLWTFLLCACLFSDCGSSPQTTNEIAVATIGCIGDFSTLPENTCEPGSQFMKIPYVPVSGGYLNPDYDPTTGQNLTGGTVEGFGLAPNYPVSTGSNASYVVQNAMSPAYWNLYWFMPWDSCGL